MLKDAVNIGINNTNQGMWKYIMDKTPADQAIKELTMLLMYLSRFSEKNIFNEYGNFAWKGYDFEVINMLDEDDYINQGSFRSKSVHINDKGIEFAKELLKKYKIMDW